MAAMAHGGGCMIGARASAHPSFAELTQRNFMTVFRKDERLATLKVTAIAVLLGAGIAVRSAAPSAAPTYEQIASDPIRTDQDRRADETRKPVEFLQFAQVKPGMRVLDVAAGAGYTTQ